MKVKLERVTAKNIKEAIRLQNEIFPNEDATKVIESSVNGRYYIGIDSIYFYIGYLNSKPIGITGKYVYKDYPKDAWLAWFGVLPKFRRKGYGAFLFNTIKNEAKEHHLDYLRLYTDETNDIAIKFYLKQGMTYEVYVNSNDSHQGTDKILIFSIGMNSHISPKWSNKYLYLKEHEAENGW